MKIDENEFFRQATISICGHLDIQKGLFASFKQLKSVMPAHSLWLERFEIDMSAIRIVAMANEKEGREHDIVIPLLAEGLKAIDAVKSAFNNKSLPDVLVINRTDDEPVSRTVLEHLGLKNMSALSLPLVIENMPIGALALLAEGPDRFTEEHAHLFSLLKEPFCIAMSNILKHREVLKLKDLLEDDKRYLESELSQLHDGQIIGADFGLKKVTEMVRQVSPLDSPVLLLGETGTGKEIIANAIHYSSPRANAPFITVNCGAIPESLIDSELFGHEKGAFTGALTEKRGRFERAHTGTIFLDEIGELPHQAQVRLLRVLQNHEIERVGGVRSIKVDIRIIAATNRNLEEMVRKGEFREDLWFRLNVFPITIPPLRDRSSDIPAFIQYFIAQKAKEMKLPVIPDLLPGTMESLLDYLWPGNVRELENIVERAIILNKNGPLDFSALLLSTTGTSSIQEKAGSKKKTETEYDTDKGANLDEVISSHISRTLEKTEGRVHGPGGAAELLGVNPSTLRHRMKKLGIIYEREEGD